MRTGRPSKGLERVIYTRVDKALQRRVKAEVVREARSRPGARVTQADVVRELLLEALAARAAGRKT